jgi:hypothetical protein
MSWCEELESRPRETSQQQNRRHTMIRTLIERPAPSSPAPVETEGARELHRLELEARRLRQAFASDLSVRFAVDLDLFIRRTAIRLGDAWRALLHSRIRAIAVRWPASSRRRIEAPPV